MRPYDLGMQLALEEAGLTKQAGSYLWNPVWDQDDPRPWHEIAKQNLATSGAGLGAGAAAGAGTFGLLSLLKRFRGGGVPLAGALIGGTAAAIPAGMAAFDAMED